MRRERIEVGLRYYLLVDVAGSKWGVSVGMLEMWPLQIHFTR